MGDATTSWAECPASVPRRMSPTHCRHSDGRRTCVWWRLSARPRCVCTLACSGQLAVTSAATHASPLLNHHHPPSPNAQLYVEACSDRSATPVRGIRSAVVSRSLSLARRAHTSPNTPTPNRQSLAPSASCCPCDHQLLCQNYGR
jgi:hypothetical protein